MEIRSPKKIAATKIVNLIARVLAGAKMRTAPHKSQTLAETRSAEKLVT